MDNNQSKVCEEVDEITEEDLQAAADFLDAIGITQEEYDNSPMGLYSF